MATKSLEQLIEDYGIQLCRTHPQLKKRKMVHGDSNQKAESNCLVFTATKGADRLDELGASDVTLRVAWRSNSASPEQNGMVANAIDECFSSRWSDKLDTPEVLNNFTAPFRIMDEEKSSDRDDSRTQRQFSYTIPIIAKLK